MEDKNELQTIDQSLEAETKSIVEGALKSTTQSELQEITDLFNANQIKREIIRANSVNKLLDKILDQAADRIENRSHEMTNKDLLDYYKTFQDTINKVSEHTELVTQQPLIQINTNTQNIGISGDGKTTNAAESMGITNDSIDNVRDFLSSILSQKDAGDIIDMTQVKKGVLIIGADNTGKTTLVNKLKINLEGKALFQNFQYEEIKNDTSDDYYGRVIDLFNNNDKVVFERFTPIDELVYGKILHPNDNHRLSDLDKYFLNNRFSFLLIYCRPPEENALDFGERVQFQGVKEHGEELLKGFDETYASIIVKYPDLKFLKYDFTNITNSDIIISKIVEFMEE